MSLNRLSYLNQKLEKVKTETEKQILEKQIKEVEQEIETIKWDIFFLCSWWRWKSVLGVYFLKFPPSFKHF